ncbi:MAG: [FeFe] hydrogenase H-cluster maturation GTPase HydF [Ruminococcaceae bacterium]|nr:[FeFe] hydrogenase H-cluster maturation GTPase HydF [Oscillospiraceae bacterium]
MSLNDTASANRVHIAFFGKRNAGKSSIMNAVTAQNIALVSDVAGTTTDPVYKTMELLPIGPVMMIDTAGMDDNQGELGALRVKKTKQVLNKTDVAVLVVDASRGISQMEQRWISLFEEKKIPYVTVYNKIDLAKAPEGALSVSAVTGEGIEALKNTLVHLAKPQQLPSPIEGLVESGDTAILVTPIDASAPKGRLILPQQQTIRALLDADAAAIVVKETMLEETLKKYPNPKLVITDSQVFGMVAKLTKGVAPLTSFSILMARQKGDLELTVQGVKALDTVKDGDKILIAEGCTHHRQCEDIGTVKLPNWIREYTGVNPEFVFCSGTEFPEELSQYKMVIHCGGCMLNAREMKYRQKSAKDEQIPITNYGIAIAYMKGILSRSLEPFPDLYQKLHS